MRLIEKGFLPRTYIRLFKVKTVFNEADKQFPSLRGVQKRYISKEGNN